MLIEFCDKCQNICSIIIVNDEYMKKCLSCSYEHKYDKKPILSKNVQNVKSSDYRISQNMIYDNTLSRTKDIKCPNELCETNLIENPKERETVMFEYNPNTHKHGYICCICKTYWKVR